MAKLLLIGDCHISPKTIPDLSKAFEQIFEIVEEENITHVFFMGDELDDHGTVKESAFNFLVSIVERLRELKVKIYLIVGNHDFRSNNIYCASEHFLNPFKKWKGVTVIDVPTEIVIAEHRIACMPYIPEGRYHEARQEFFDEDVNNFSFFLSHQGFAGGTLDNGLIFEGSDKWLKKWCMNYTGHFHTPHSPQKNICYVGSLIPLKFSEDVQKRVIILDLPEGGGEHMSKEIKMKNQVHYTTVRIDVKNPPKKLEKSEKLRYILTGGTMSELTRFHADNRKIIGSKVKFEPVQEDTLVPTGEVIDLVAELRKQGGDRFDKYFPEDIDNVGIKLPKPKNEIKLIFTKYLHFENVEIDLQTGINALHGKNGTGKTVLLNSILWLLYSGHAPSRDKVDITMSTSKWSIRRYTKPSHGVTILLDKKEYTGEVAQNIIVRTFGSKEFFEACYFLKQGSRCDFLSSSIRDKKNLLNLFFGIAPIEEVIDEHRKEVEKSLEKATVNYNDFLETIGDEQSPETPELPDLPAVDPRTVEIVPPNYTDLEEIPLPLIDSIPRVILPKPDLTETEKIKEQIPPEPVFNSETLPKFIRVKLEEPEEPKTTAEKIEKETRNYEKTLEGLVKCEIDLKLYEEKLLEQKEIRSKIDELNGSLPAIELVTEAKKKLACQEALEQNIHEPYNYSDEDISKNEVIFLHWKNSEFYQQKYNRLPSKERLSEIDNLLKLQDSIEGTCAHCQGQLLIHVDRNKTLAIEKRPDDFVRSDLKDLEDERKALLKTNFVSDRPQFTSEEMRQRRKKYQDLQEYEKYKDFDAESILASYEAISDELKILRSKIQKIKTPEKTRAQIDEERNTCNKKLKSLEKAKQRLEDYEKDLAKYNVLKESEDQRYEEHRKEVDRIKGEQELRRKEYESLKKQILETYEREKNSILEIYRREQKSLDDERQRKYDELISNINRENQRKKEEKEIRMQRYEKDIKELEEKIETYTKLIKLRETLVQKHEKEKAEYQKRLTKKSKLESKVEKLRVEAIEVAEDLTLYRKIYREVLTRKMNMWDSYFTDILQRIYKNAKGKIEFDFKDNKSYDKITLILQIKGKEYAGTTKLSWGTFNLVSLAFQLAMIILVPTNFKIILLDEPLSNLDTENKEKIIDILDEYLERTFTVIANHDRELLHGFAEICLDEE